MSTTTQQEMAARRRRLALAAALEAIGSVEALALVEPLAYQPRSTFELAGNAGLDSHSAEELLRGLANAGVVAPWSKGSWQFTPIGGEVWQAVAPLLRRLGVDSGSLPSWS